MSDEDDVLDVTAVVMQQLAWDIVPCELVNEDMWRTLGLLPPSQDVADAAHQESHDRLSACQPLVAFTEVYVTLASEIVTKMMVKFAVNKIPGQDAQMPESFLKALNIQNVDVVHSAIYPLLAAMLEAGIITYGPAMGNVLG